MSTETTDRPQSTGSSRRRRGPAFFLGLVCVLAGLGVLGYVAWQYYGTNIVSRQAQQRLVDDVQKAWGAGAPAQGTADQPVLQGKDAPEPEPGEPFALLRVPAFGDDYVMPVLESVEDEALTKGYGHFEDTAMPGEVGNFALAAHRVTHGEPLRDMPKLRPGDEVVVETREAVYTYELTTNPNDLVIDFKQVWVLDPVPSNPDGGVQPDQQQGQRLITLTTCAELFHTDERMIAFGHLVDTEPK